VLSKPDVTFLVVISTFAGFYMGATGRLDVLLLMHALLGTTMVAAGSSALNQYFERESDALMRRTASRPLPRGMMNPSRALWFGIGMAALGTFYLAVAVNLLASLLGALTCISYLGAYTPLKKRTTLATFVGAFPGAVPPLIGWAAARGSLSVEAGALYLILFLWQFPHFLAIAWMYREDYSRAGIRMLPVVDQAGKSTFAQILGYAVALVPAAALPSVLGMTGVNYLFGSIVLVCQWAARTKSNTRARWLMHASVIHLPLLFALMLADKVWR
jgi:protoheme IX farnesyltransferase